MKGDDNELLTVYGRVLYFFLHEFQECMRMLAYLQCFRVKDHSPVADRRQKVVELERLTRREVICVTAIDEGIGIMTSAGRQYLINRGAWNPETALEE